MDLLGSWLRATWTIVILALAGAAQATPTQVVIDTTISFTSGDQTALFPLGQPFRVTYTYDPDTPDFDGMVNGGGAFPGSLSAMTIELAGLTFEFAGGMTANIFTLDDLGLAPFLTDGATLLPGDYVSGDLLDGLTPVDVEVEMVQTASSPPSPTLVVNDVLQTSYAYDFVSVTLRARDGSDLLETVVASVPGVALPEPSPAVFASFVGLGLLAARGRR